MSTRSRAPGRAARTRSRVTVPSLGWAALGVLAFSITFPATTLAERSFSPLLVGAGRSVPSALLAAACLRALRAPRPQRRHWPGLVAVGLGCGIGFGVLSALALGKTSSSHAAVVVGLLPAATAAVAVVRVGDRPPPLFWAASLLGTAVVTAYALSRGAGSLHPADLLLLASVLVAAIGYAEGGRLTRLLPGWQVTAWGLVIVFPISLALTGVAIAGGGVRTVHPEALAGFAYVGTVSTFFGFFAWYRGLAEAGVARASQIQLGQPLLTILWSAPLLGEGIDGLGVATAVLVAVCVFLTQRSRFARAAAA
jgi:drug/metabolite transporter (DMT)-like permease